MAARRRLMTAATLSAVALVAFACDSSGAGVASASATPRDGEQEGPETVKATLNGATFTLELALDDNTRYRGLSGREEIPRSGGMLFVFPDVQSRWFVMRDCPIPIDIAFLDGSGRVVAMHTMAPEAPRGVDESATEYEARLKRYPSRFGAQFAIETAGGRLVEIGLEVGQAVRFDAEGLKARAR